MFLMPLDFGESWVTPTFSLGADQAKVNRSYQYWHQRINNSGCWNKVRLGQFDLGTGMWHGISYQGLLDVVALAMQVHNGSSAWVVQDSISTTQESSSKKSFMRISMTSTTKWYVNTGGWMVGTRASNGMLADYVVNPMQQPGKDIAFTSAAWGHNLVMGSEKIYEKSITKKAWTGAFVFVASLVVGALTGGIGGLALSALTPGILAGGAIGGLGGLMASGFNPTTSQACSFTPFNNTATQLKPDYSSDLDKTMVQVMTYFKWLGPSIETSSGLAAYVMELHPKKILGCGGQAYADCGQMADVIGMDDPRFASLMETMYHQPAREVREQVYPYAPR